MFQSVDSSREKSEYFDRKKIDTFTYIKTYERVDENVWWNPASKIQNPTAVFWTVEIQNSEVLEKATKVQKYSQEIKMFIKISECVR